MLSHTQNRRGFTLIEMMIVVLVIAVLATLVGIAVRHAGDRAKESAQVSHLDHLNWAAMMYKNDTGQYPATLEDLVAAEGTGPTGYQGPYFTPPVPKDPFTNSDYVYDPSTGLVTAP